MITEDGWPSCGPDQLEYRVIQGTGESVGLQKGPPSIILTAFMGALNKHVEEAADTRGGTQDEGGWTGTNLVPTSNHLGGTAFDYNWRDHPMGPQVPDPAAGWQGSAITNWQPEEPFVRELLRYCTYDGLQMVWWANDWNDPHDSMHFQMNYNTFGDPRVQKFIDECINPDTGMLRFFDDKGDPNVDLVATLSELMGNTVGVDYAALLPAWQTFCVDAELDSDLRIAMAAAQLGEESAGLKYMEEIADGSEYEGNEELGNTQPGDGRRFKGRGPIQVTGRDHYAALSQWAFDRGLVPTRTYFVDNPEELAGTTYGFMGAAWYWLTHTRADDGDNGVVKHLNQYADEGDVIGATKAVNGGTHGLPDRQFRYTRAMRMGDRLLAFRQTQEDDWMSDLTNAQKLDEIHRETVRQKSPSRSFMAEDGKLIDSPLGIDWNTDGNVWTLVLTEAYRLNVTLAVNTVEYIAKNGVYPETYASEDFNAWLATFGQEYCQGLVAEKKAKQPSKSVPNITKKKT